MLLHIAQLVGVLRKLRPILFQTDWLLFVGRWIRWPMGFWIRSLSRGAALDDLNLLYRGMDHQRLAPTAITVNAAMSACDMAGHAALSIRMYESSFQAAL